MKKKKEREEEKKKGVGCRLTENFTVHRQRLAWQRPGSSRSREQNKIVGETRNEKRETATRNAAFKEIQVEVSREGGR